MLGARRLRRQCAASPRLWQVAQGTLSTTGWERGSHSAHPTQANAQVLTDRPPPPDTHTPCKKAAGPRSPLFWQRWEAENKVSARHF